jgi:hypothetical protein
MKRLILTLILILYLQLIQVDFERSKAVRRVDILHFPSILTIRVNRVQFDRTLMQTVKSNDYLYFQKTIYLERYSSNLDPIIAARRERMTNVRRELMEAKTSLGHLTTLKAYPITPLNILQQTVNIMQMHPQHLPDPTLLETMQQHIGEVRCQAAQLEQKIFQLEQEKASMFKDATHNEYHLFGIFLHEGEANFGHYWLLLYDAPRKRWLKYNDSLVIPVSEDQVFQDTTGKTFNAQSLIYVQSDKLESLTNVMVRNEGFRNKYPK